MSSKWMPSGQHAGGVDREVERADAGAPAVDVDPDAVGRDLRVAAREAPHDRRVQLLAVDADVEVLVVVEHAHRRCARWGARPRRGSAARTRRRAAAAAQTAIVEAAVDDRRLRASASAAMWGRGRQRARGRPARAWASTSARAAAAGDTDRGHCITPAHGNRGSLGRAPRRADFVRHPQSRRGRAAAGAAAGAPSCARSARRRSRRWTSATTPTSTPASAASAPRVLLNAHVDTVPAERGLHVAAAPAGAAGRSAVRPRHRRHQGRDRGDPGGAGGRARSRGRSACCSRATRSTAAAASARSSTATRRAGWSGRSSASRRAAGWACATAASAPRRSRWRRPGGHSSRVDDMVNPIAVLARAAVALDDMGDRIPRQGAARVPGHQPERGGAGRRHRVQRRPDARDADVLAAPGARATASRTCWPRPSAGCGPRRRRTRSPGR